MNPVTEIVGTYRDDLKVGDILKNQPFQSYGNNSQVSFEVLRETTEEEYRQKYNYKGAFPFDILGRQARFFEIRALD